MACDDCNQAVAQNDIADFLRSLIDWIKKAADFFDSLNADVAKAQAANPCLAAYFDGTREDATKAVEAFLMGQPDRMRTLFECFRGANGELPERVSIQVNGKAFIEIDWQPLVLCAVKAAAAWIVNRDTIAALVLFVGCAFGAGGGNGGNPNPPTPDPAKGPVGKVTARGC